MLKLLVAVLLWLLLLARFTRAAACGGGAEAEEGVLFGCQLEPGDAFPDLPAATAGSVSVLFSASQRGRAGLPDWLVLQQQEEAPLSHAFLYGTPPSSSSSTRQLEIEVTALRRDSFEAAVLWFNITILPPQGSVLLLAELLLTNYELPELLDDVVLQSLTAALAAAFNSPSAAIVSVLPPSSPSPPPPAKSGVIVQVTPGLDVSSITTATASQAAVVQGNCSGRDLSLPPINLEVLSEASFQTDWCQYRVYEPSPSPSVSAPRPPPSGTAPELPPPGSGGGSRLSLVVIVVLCGVALVLLLTGLAWAFFGGRRRGFYVSNERRRRKAVSVEDARSCSQGPLKAQQQLSSLSKVPCKSPTGQVEERVEGEGEDTLLEFRDLTDYHQTAAGLEERAPPPYEFRDPPRRYRLITL